MKDSFILYNSFYEPIKSLKNEQLGKLLRAIFDYTINGVITQDNDIIVAFMFIKNQIDLDTKKWEEEKAKRSEAGKKGMQNRWHNKNNSVITKDNKDNNVINDITNITDNVNVNDNDNVNVNDNINTSSSSNNNIYSYLETNLGRTLNGAEIELATMWVNEYDWKKIEYAIKETLMARANNLKYTDAILRNIKDKSNDELYSKTKEEDEEEIEMPDYDWLNESD